MPLWKVAGGRVCVAASPYVLAIRRTEGRPLCTITVKGLVNGFHGAHTSVAVRQCRLDCNDFRDVRTVRSLVRTVTGGRRLDGFVSGLDVTNELDCTEV
jgi:hypothetical protein